MSEVSFTRSQKRVKTQRWAKIEWKHVFGSKNWVKTRFSKQNVDFKLKLNKKPLLPLKNPHFIQNSSRNSIFLSNVNKTVSRISLFHAMSNSSVRHIPQLTEHVLSRIVCDSPQIAYRVRSDCSNWMFILHMHSRLTHFQAYATYPNGITHLFERVEVLIVCINAVEHTIYCNGRYKNSQSAY